MKQATPTHIRLKAEENEQIESVRAALSQSMGSAPVTKAHAMHVMLARGYEVLAAELGLPKGGTP